MTPGLAIGPLGVADYLATVKAAAGCWGNLRPVMRAASGLNVRNGRGAAAGGRNPLVQDRGPGPKSRPSWVRPKGFMGPCPGCGSTTCPGWYKPDGDHLLSF
jgi:hypothetical protein